jgi:membrane associated rhomboid family serine protease
MIGSLAMRLLFVTLLLLTITAAPAQAYIGPGLGVGAIAAFFGALLAALLAVLGFFWYPIKRLRRKRRQERARQADPTGDHADR